MLHFYAKLFWQSFAVFFQRTARWRNAIWILAYIAAIVALFNEPIGRLIMEQWQAAPAWYGLAILAIVFLYGFLTVNYRKHVEREERIHSLEERLSPKLGIIFDEQRFGACRMEWTDPNSFTGQVLAVDIKVRLFRVGIQNKSSTTIDGVKL